MPPKRNVLTLKQKVKIVETYNAEKPSIRYLAKRYEIGKTQAAEIVKNRDQLLNKWFSNSNINEKRSFLKEEGRNIDRLCYDWFVRAQSKGIPLTGPLVKTKAKEIAASLGYNNFSASEGWLEKFRKRHNIAFKAISGESAAVNPDDVANFLSKVPSIIKNYSPEDIYNADETGLFFRALPNKTLALKGQKCSGGKLSKERVTILHCVNMNGQKEKLLVIGKSAKPRAFKNVNLNDLPVIWKSNKKAWMTAEIMTHWLRSFDREVGIQKRKILLFLDNACSHPNGINLTNIQLIFLPPNCTSVCQPLDQGIIKSFKTIYRTFIVKELLSKIDTVTSVRELANKINLLDAIFLIKNAWDRVSKDTIINCFRKAGFLSQSSQDSETDDFDAEEDNIPLSLLARILKRSDELGFEESNMEEFFKIDNDVIVEDVDDSIVIETALEEVESSDESTGDEMEITGCIKTLKDAMDVAQKLKLFVKASGDLPALELVSKLELHFQDALIKKPTRQTKILDFFST